MEVESISRHISHRQRGEPGIQNHVRDVGPYTIKGRKGDGPCRKIAHGQGQFSSSLVALNEAVAQHACSSQVYVWYSAQVDRLTRLSPAGVSDGATSIGAAFFQ